MGPIYQFGPASVSATTSLTGMPTAGDSPNIPQIVFQRMQTATTDNRPLPNDLPVNAFVEVRSNDARHSKCEMLSTAELHEGIPHALDDLRIVFAGDVTIEAGRAAIRSGPPASRSGFGYG
ncbi:hypothetical protein [Paraburkholderia adhaesiva]|uniref:hypothetical protein n=1 Tax=Paraburkholderia adhaesiva TaxID=2883244 RepID=UPI001F1E48ED|nr:hypothetical protein [Paraburkholderia adhaesiva]